MATADRMERDRKARQSKARKSTSKVKRNAPAPFIGTGTKITTPKGGTRYVGKTKTGATKYVKPSKLAAAPTKNKKK